MKKNMFLFSLLILAIGLMAQTTIKPELGDGSEVNPYQIATWQNLYWITVPGTVDGLTQADRWSKHYIQTSDIDFADATPAINTWDNSAGWTPIGQNDDFSFTGTYDGNYKTITGLYINRPLSNKQGLFSQVLENGSIDTDIKIKNLGLINISITGNDYTGGLVGKNWGTITNCYSTGNVTGNNYTGGLIGWERCTITNCFSTVNVTGNDYTGGLVGENIFSSIFNCYSTGNVAGNDYTGGLAGKNILYTICNCYSTGNVAGNNYTGGLVGENSEGKINDCYSTGNVAGNSNKGGLVGENSDGTITKCFWDIQTSGLSFSAGGIGKTTDEMQTQNIYSDAGWNFYFPWKIESNCYPVLKPFNELNIIGLGSESYPYEIANIYQLVWLSFDPSVWNKHYKQTADITFPTEINTWDSSKGWSPIGGDNNLVFTGSYDGDNRTISGLYIHRPLTNYQGFFGYTLHFAEIKNIGLININIEGNVFTGGLVGKNSGSITNCYDSGSVTGNGRIGGLVGQNESGTITECYNTGSVIGYGGTGGLVGWNESGTITECYNTGSVTGNSGIGGLVGDNYYGTIKMCYNIGNLIGGNYTGGLVGWNESGTITECNSTGNVSGNNDTGGLVGYNNFGAITYCYNNGSIAGLRSSGGMVGQNEFGTITSCYSTGSVYGNEFIGGFIGFHNEGTITNCYSTGNVSGNLETGGLVGQSNCATINYSFWDIETSGQSTSAGGTGKATVELKNISTFTEAGWLFPNVWLINTELNNGYPYLNYPNSVANDDIVIIPSLNSIALLKNAYPNPFNPSTTLSFELSSPEIVKIDIYNVKGQLVKSLVKGSYNTGIHSMVWDGKDNKGYSSCSGVYFYKMQAGKNSQTKKMMLMK